MIRIRVQVGQDGKRRAHELFEAVKQHARVWRSSDLRRTRNLTLIHEARNVKGKVREVKSVNPEYLAFNCTARTAAEEAITAGRFVHLVLRDLAEVSDITLHRR